MGKAWERLTSGPVEGVREPTEPVTADAALQRPKETRKRPKAHEFH